MRTLTVSRVVSFEIVIKVGSVPIIYLNVKGVVINVILMCGFFVEKYNALQFIRDIPHIYIIRLKKWPSTFCVRYLYSYDEILLEQYYHLEKIRSQQELE